LFVFREGRLTSFDHLLSFATDALLTANYQVSNQLPYLEIVAYCDALEEYVGMEEMLRKLYQREPRSEKMIAGLFSAVTSRETWMMNNRWEELIKQGAALFFTEAHEFMIKMREHAGIMSMQRAYYEPTTRLLLARSLSTQQKLKKVLLRSNRYPNWFQP
jgi:hypothetical protein